MANVPKIRFPGFNDPWEQRKLGDECSQLTTVINPQNEPNRLFAEYSMPAYDLNKNPDYVLGSTMNSARKVVDRPCLLINKLNVRKQRIWCIEGPEKNAVCSAEFIPVCSEGIDLRFLSYVVSGNAFTSYLEDCSSGSSNSQKRVTPDTIMNAEICIPSRAEQQKIGAFFRGLDHFITLHQSKLDDLKTMKKCLLQKMFPKEGENTPELRFPGFTDPWEQRKLRDISSLITKGTTPLDKSGVGDVNFIKVENLDSNSGEVIPGSKISMDEHEGYLKRSQLKAGDILFSIAGTLGRVGIIKSSVLPANTNQALAIIRTKEGNINYISTALRGRAVTDFIHRNPTVGAQPNLSLEQVGDLEIPYPSLDEQKEIGDYFKRLDNLITLHQSKLDDLKELKKGLLQQMFVD